MWLNLLFAREGFYTYGNSQQFRDGNLSRREHLISQLLFHECCEGGGLLVRNVRCGSEGGQKLSTLSVKFPVTSVSTCNRHRRFVWCSRASSRPMPVLSQKLVSLVSSADLTHDFRQLLFGGPLFSINEVPGIVFRVVRWLLQGEIPVVADCL